MRGWPYQASPSDGTARSLRYHGKNPLEGLLWGDHPKYNKRVSGNRRMVATGSKQPETATIRINIDNRFYIHPAVDEAGLPQWFPIGAPKKSKQPDPDVKDDIERSHYLD